MFCQWKVHERGQKRFIESIEIGPHVVRNFVSTVVHETDFRPFTCVSGVTIQICQLGKEAVPNDKALFKNVIKVWSKPARL
ncbi:hypothetical protein CEXT_234441 [Caerostris extrusa]|uniref:Uncharacterized protein n=1 Tax=Caerostris extrusa TaxID=172846 RepID=A0AAV4YAL6_CAEEX|nr:hypothetical protein CEXT_234441 [Caerostris extrusa]